MNKHIYIYYISIYEYTGINIYICTQSRIYIYVYIYYVSWKCLQACCGDLAKGYGRAFPTIILATGSNWSGSVIDCYCVDQDLKNQGPALWKSTWSTASPIVQTLAICGSWVLDHCRINVQPACTAAPSIIYIYIIYIRLCKIFTYICICMIYNHWYIYMLNY